MPTIHVLYPHHTIANDEYSHCAFTGKARRFAAMMKPFGYTVHEYSNAGSMSAADVKHVMLNEAEFKAHFTEETSSPGAQANPHTPAGMIFRQRLARALAEYAKPGDIVAHIWTAYWELIRDFPRLNHFETGIGYPNDGIGAYRIFESYAWMHFHWGRYCSPGGVIPMNQQSYDIDKNPACTWVVPNYYDPTDWPFVAEPENYVVFMARFVVDKGIEMLRDVIKAWHKRHPDDGMKFMLAGMGGYPAWLAASDFTPAELARIDYRGVVNGPARAVMVGRARAMLLPSIFVEPFGGSGVESMLCGTPLIAPDFGAFTETVEDGATGFRCRTVDDYVRSIEDSVNLDRSYVSERAQDRYSLKACGAKYHDIFQRVTTRAGVVW
jgi:glycosyltransferase involved in cell wall biosynthesis